MTRSSSPARSADPHNLGLAVDRQAEVPIGVQLAWALRARIYDGTFAPGERLPGMRDLADVTGVNVNTVRAVYQRLEHEGLIDSQQGSGTFVADTQHWSSAVGAIAADAAREAHSTGVDPREVAAALYVSGETPFLGEAETSSQPRPDAVAAERRRQLHAQIAGLERTLSELEVAHPGLLLSSTQLSPTGSSPIAPPQTRRVAGPALLSVADLEQVRTTLVRRLADMQKAIDALGTKPDDRVEPIAAKATTIAAKATTKSKSKSKSSRASKSDPRQPKARPAAAGA